MARLRAPKGGCTIRAYRHGLGDCFLMAFANNANRQHYVLIDCGVLVGTKDVKDTMSKVARDISEATNNHLDALVMTHQHWDHISGFGQAADEFKRIDVEELWVSWAEDESDPVSKELLDRYGAALTSLRAAEPFLQASNSRQARRTRDFMGFLGPLGPGERLSTDKIMKQMLEKFSDRSRFCTPGDEPHRISGLPGVSFFVLGPPRDVDFIKKSQPSHGDVYLTDPRENVSASLMQAVESCADPESKKCNWLPFSESFSAEYDPEVTADRRNNLQFIKDKYEVQNWRKIDLDWVDGMSDLAIKLDNHLNNTSLVLAIELEDKGRVLLFPADAQVGNWRSWHTVEWENQPDVTAEDLLNRTVFYKVGHHASHNATLGEKGLEMMTSPDLRAVIPLDRKTAEKRNWHMPYDKLFTRLNEKTNNRTYITDDATKPTFSTNHSELYCDFEFTSVSSS